MDIPGIRPACGGASREQRQAPDAVLDCFHPLAEEAAPEQAYWERLSEKVASADGAASLAAFFGVESKEEETFASGVGTGASVPAPFAQTFDRACALAPSLRWPGSVGSLGHPELCSRPCLHAAFNGFCAKGSACEYCHMPHKERRRVKFDKKERQWIANVRPEEWLPILIPIVREKVYKEDTSVETQALLDDLVAGCQAVFAVSTTLPAKPEPTSSLQKSIQRVMESMSTAQSLRAVLEAVYVHNLSIADVVYPLLTHLVSLRISKSICSV